MKTFVILLFAMLGTASAHADDVDHFAQLEGLYQTAALPTTASLVGWFSGRCYLADARTTPINTAFVGWNETQEKFKGVWLQHSGETADYYDELSTPIENEIADLIDGNADQVLAAMIDGKSLVTGIADGTKWRIRQASDVTVMQLQQFGVNAAYCYLAKKLK